MVCILNTLVAVTDIRRGVNTIMTFLWLRKGLNWKRYRRPMGSCKSKISLMSGRNKATRWSLRPSEVGKCAKYVIMLFQEANAPGKKLLEYLFVLHFIFRKTVNKNDLWFGGNLLDK